MQIEKERLRQLKFEEDERKRQEEIRKKQEEIQRIEKERIEKERIAREKDAKEWQDRVKEAEREVQEWENKHRAEKEAKEKEQREKAQEAEAKEEELELRARLLQAKAARSKAEQLEALIRQKQELESKQREAKEKEIREAREQEAKQWAELEKIFKEEKEKRARDKLEKTKLLLAQEQKDLEKEIEKENLLEAELEKELLEADIKAKEELEQLQLSPNEFFVDIDEKYISAKEEIFPELKHTFKGYIQGEKKVGQKRVNTWIFQFFYDMEPAQREFNIFSSIGSKYGPIIRAFWSCDKLSNKAKTQLFSYEKSLPKYCIIKQFTAYTLADTIKADKGRSSIQRWTTSYCPLIRKLVKCLQELHHQEPPLVWGDFNPKNIGYLPSPRALRGKPTDYKMLNVSTAKIANGDVESFPLTIWSPPERFLACSDTKTKTTKKEGEMNTSYDIWSLALVIIEIVIGETVTQITCKGDFEEWKRILVSKDLYKKAKKKILDRFKQPQHIKLRELLTSMLNYNPKKRPSADSVLAHEALDPKITDELYITKPVRDELSHYPSIPLLLPKGRTFGERLKNLLEESHWKLDKLTLLLCCEFECPLILGEDKQQYWHIPNEHNHKGFSCKSMKESLQQIGLNSLETFSGLRTVKHFLTILDPSNTIDVWIKQKYASSTELPINHLRKLLSSLEKELEILLSLSELKATMESSSSSNSSGSSSSSSDDSSIKSPDRRERLVLERRMDPTWKVANRIEREISKDIIRTKKKDTGKPQLRRFQDGSMYALRKLIREGPSPEDIIQGLQFTTITREDCPAGKVDDSFWLCKTHRALITRWNDNKFRSPHDFVAEHERLTWKVTKVTMQLSGIRNFSSTDPIQLTITDGVRLDQKFLLPPIKSSTSSSPISDKPTITIDLPWSFSLVLPKLRMELRTKKIISSYSTTLWSKVGNNDLLLGRICLPWIPTDVKRDCKVNSNSVTPFFVTDSTSRMVEVELKRGVSTTKEKASPPEPTTRRYSQIAPASTQLFPTLQFDLTWWTSRPHWDAEESYHI